MLRRLIAGGLVAALTLGTTTAALGAPDTEGVKGGGSVLVPATGVYGSVSIRAEFTDDGVTGRVNLDLYAPGTDLRVQHFKGRITDVAIDAGGVVYLCGDVKLLQLGTNTKQGRFFEMVVRDDGQPGEHGDVLGWYRKGSPTDCTDDRPYPEQQLVEGNLKVVD